MVHTKGKIRPEAFNKDCQCSYYSAGDWLSYGILIIILTSILLEELCCGGFGS